MSIDIIVNARRSLCTVKIKVKQSHYRPGQAEGFQEFEAPRFQDFTT